jgi:low temperature requirement protein LtrA
MGLPSAVRGPPSSRTPRPRAPAATGPIVVAAAIPCRGCDTLAMAEPGRTHRISARRRDGATVTPLELFFDLVFVLAITQCSSLMESGHGWRTVVQGLLVLGVLWWSWVGYAWLTSDVDPDDWLPRVVMFVAMAAMLVVALCVPHAFDDRALGLTLAGGYALVRAAHIGLYAIASADDPQLRRAVTYLGCGAVVGVSLIGVAALLDGWVQGLVWFMALAIDMAVPFLFGSDGWHVEPRHFAERHGLIVLIALGESIVALGAGATVGLTGGIISAAVLGVVLAAAMWWSYFDVGSQLAARRLVETPPGQVQNEMARDGYSLLHYPIVAGVVVVALALEHVLGHVDEPLDAVASVALGGGLALFLFGQVAFKLRMTGLLARQRVVPALVLVLAIPLFRVVDGWVSLAIAATVMWLLIAWELRQYRDVRTEIRRWEGTH